MAEGSDEPTIVCPNCGALVPVGAPNCFICEEKMPEPAPPKRKEEIEPVPEELPPTVPGKEAEPQVVAIPAVEEAKVAPPVKEGAESKAARLKAAFEAGRIPEDVYLENLKSLGLSVSQEPVAKPAKEEIPVASPGTEEAGLQAAWLKTDYEAGKISREMYLESLKELGLPAPAGQEPKPEPEVIPPQLPTIEEKKEEPPAEAKPAVEGMKVEPSAEERRIVEEKMTEPPVKKTPEKPPKKPKGAADKQAKDAKKLARLKRAYDTGKITKEYYLENLKTLGAPVPPELEAPPAIEEKPPEKPEAKPEVPREAEAKPEVKEEVPPEKPELKIEAAPPAVEAPKEAPVAPPSEAEVKAGRLKEAFQDGRITKEIYLRNLKILGVPASPEVEKTPETLPETKEVVEAEATPPVEEEIEERQVAEPSDAEVKAGKLKAAYMAGRIPRDVYVGNLKILGVTVPPELEPVTWKEPEIVEEVETETSAPVEEEIKEEEAAVSSEAEVRAERLREAYEEGRIPKGVYLGNLKLLGLPVPEDLAEKEEAAEAEVAPVKEWTMPEEIAKEIEEAAAPAEAEAAVEVVEEVAVEEVSAEAEETAAVEEVAAEPTRFMSRGEIEGPERSYRGVAIASAGGLVYVLIWLLFIPMLGNFISALVSMLGAVLIVVGYNVASGDAAAAARARTFSCPLCDKRLDLAVTECPNCGAMFSD